MKRRRIVGVHAVAPQTEKPKEEKKVENDNSSVKNDFMEVLFYQAKQRDGLLGEYSLDGTYSIKNEKIIEGLLSIEKVLQEFDNESNVAYASTKIGSVILNFKIEFELAESYCSAHLKIIEIERKFDESIKHIQNLEDVVDIYSPLFVQNTFKRWNIVKEADELDKRNVVVGYLDLQERNKNFMKELSEILAQLYVMRMLQVLAGCGEIGEKVIAEYNLTLEKLLSQDPGFSQNNSRLKDLLDEIILKHKAMDVVLLNGGEEVMKSYIQPINKLRGKEPDVIEVVPTKKVESAKKSATSNTKKSSDSKSASKSDNSKGGGGGSNNKGNKKDDKKDNKKDDKKKSPIGLKLSNIHNIVLPTRLRAVPQQSRTTPATPVQNRTRVRIASTVQRAQDEDNQLESVLSKLDEPLANESQKEGEEKANETNNIEGSLLNYEDVEVETIEKNDITSIETEFIK